MWWKSLWFRHVRVTNISISLLHWVTGRNIKLLFMYCFVISCYFLFLKSIYSCHYHGRKVVTLETACTVSCVLNCGLLCLRWRSIKVREQMKIWRHLWYRNWVQVIPCLQKEQRSQKLAAQLFLTRVTTLNMALLMEFLLQNSLLHGKDRLLNTINYGDSRNLQHAVWPLLGLTL